MAAYAALVSVMQIIDQLERHPSPPITLEKQLVESLTQIVSFLQEFLEGYDSPFAYSDEADPLEMRIADAAYKVEDVIESHIVDVIDQLRRHRSDRSSFFTCFSSEELAVPLEMHRSKFYQNAREVLEEMDVMKKGVMEEMMNREESAVQPHQQQRRIFRSSSLTGKSSSGMMVGFDDALVQLLDKLTRGAKYRQVIHVTGMGGIGKTTLARNIFANALVKEYFHICAWVTVSQQYSIRDMICQILSQVINGHKNSEKSEEELGDELRKYLFGWKYLIIMDDIWSVDVWEKMKFIFVDCNNGSRIIVTTRLSYLASQMSDSYAFSMDFLGEADSWNLFMKIVFPADERFPLVLDKIGKKIVKLCKGLPLSIVVIGGLLAKSQPTKEYWERIERKLSSIVN